MKTWCWTSVGVAACLAFASPAAAQSFSGWPALATDRVARDVGDSLTVIVLETSTAANSAQNTSGRSTRFNGQVTAGDSLSEAARLELQRDGGSAGETRRTGRLIAQISVRVEEVYSNGDLRVSGRQRIAVNGEETAIRLAGRVRAADISGDNVVLSSRLADVDIDYDGSGFVSDASRPGLIASVLEWLGL